jgi:broad specificity phosphatase PhoE
MPARMPPVPTRLVLIRHGRAVSDGGPELLLGGRTDAALTDAGRAEARCLAARLRGAAPFPLIYSSPLRRAASTAQALEAAGLGTVRYCAALREIDCGALDGAPLEEVRRAFPDVWAANLRQDDDGFRYPGGESYREFRARCLAAMRAIARAHRGARIAVVTHAGVVSQVVGKIRGMSPARWDCHRPGTTGITEIAWNRRAQAVLTFDDRSHLASAR